MTLPECSKRILRFTTTLPRAMQITQGMDGHTGNKMVGKDACILLRKRRNRRTHTDIYTETTVGSADSSVARILGALGYYMENVFA